MMRWRPSLILVALLALLAAPAAAAPTIRGVFVGIDRYAFARSPGRPEAAFDNLSGAVADTRTILATLSQALGRPFGSVPADGCEGRTAIAVTLVNACATKANITDRWRRMIDASAPQDIVILYFAGHGSRLSDLTTLDQASRYNSTLMAHDARGPGPLGTGEIIDHEVRAIINRATARGVRVVTIFDSCNSGTANRDGQSASRSAPPLRAVRLQRQADLPIHGNLGAWRVHLAAAGDGQDATEVGAVGQRAGRFTTALARAISANPQASFADLAAQALAEVTAGSGNRQVPHAEGALRASFAGEEIRVPIFDAVADGNRLVMMGGALLGVTAGSRFSLFGAASAALNADSAPLATARVVSVANSVAVLQPEGTSVARLPPRLVARELSHEFGGPVLPVAVESAGAAAIVAGIGFVRSAPGAAILLRDDPAGGLLLERRGGPLLARLPPPGSADLPPRLTSALGKIARVEQWLTLLRRPPDLCLAVSNAPSANYDPGRCGPPPPAGVTLSQRSAIRLGIVNRAPEPRQLYVLHIGPRYDVTVVLPAFGGRDSAVQPGDAVRDSLDIFPTEPGAVRIVGLSSSVSLNVSVLEQTGTDVVDGDACLSAVARAFCRSADTSRSGTAGEADAWSAVIIPARVQP